jgi:hypothetical protein
MAGIIDSFFVQIGLDASQFTIGQREADKAWTKTKDQTVAAAILERKQPIEWREERSLRGTAPFNALQNDRSRL